jgi:two-component system sensor histidine kinase KdpD
MIAATRLGRGPSLAAAALSVACYDFFFVPPFHTFAVHNQKYFLTFAMMFGVGFVMSELTGRLRRQEQEALAREERTAVLYALTKELASTDIPTQIAATAAKHAAELFTAQVVVLVASADDELRPLGATPANATIDDKALGVARWAFEHDELAGRGTDTLPGSETLCVPLRAGQSRLGALALVTAQSVTLRLDQRAFLDVFCRQVASALARARLSEEARAAALRAKAEEMRSSLLSAVSHDLRTPLASITGAATALRDDVNLTQKTQVELVESIVDQAERLERLVANLLDMTRLESGSLALKRDWVPLEEIVGSALTRLEVGLEHRRVSVDIATDVPLVLVDPVLFEQLFVNLLENAEKYTPQDSAIEIRARVQDDRVAIDVLDHGSGLPSGTESKVFEKFFRGPHSGTTGAGLGLPICRGIAEAHGGSILAENRATGGAVFHVVIPIGGIPPSIAPNSGAGT